MCTGRAPCLGYGKRPPRVWFRRLLFLAAAVLGVAGVQALAADPTPSARDMMLTVQARRAFLEDPQLAAQELNVSIKDHVARVWGMVPTEELRKHAHRKLQQLPGVFVIRNEITVGVKAPDLLLMPDEGPTGHASASPDPQTGSLSVLTGRVPGRLSSAVQEASEDLRPQSAAVSLLPPVALAPTATETAPAGDAIDAVLDRIRASDARFRSLVIVRRDAQLILSPTAEQAEAAMLLARQLARIPGVQTIHIQSARPTR